MIPILLRSLALTLGAELALAALLGPRRRKVLETVLLMNLATNPPAVYCVTLARKFWPPGPALAVFLALEVLVWLAEAGLLRVGADYVWKRALGYSLALNGASCALGILFSKL